MLRDELIVSQMRIRAIHAIDLVRLTSRQVLVRIETPPPLEQSLSSQHFVEPGDAAGEVVRGIEKRRVGVSNLRAKRQQFRRASLAAGADGVELFDGAARPDGPVA